MRVAVKNNGPAWSARFNGEEYAFPAGEEIILSEHAAMFFFAFGMGDADRARVLVRNGWWKRTDASDNEASLEAARKRLMQFSFKTLGDVERVKPVPKVLQPATVTSHKAEAEKAEAARAQLPGRKGPLAPGAAA